MALSAKREKLFHSFSQWKTIFSACRLNYNVCTLLDICRPSKNISRNRPFLDLLLKRNIYIIGTKQNSSQSSDIDFIGWNTEINSINFYIFICCKALTKFTFKRKKIWTMSKQVFLSKFVYVCHSGTSWKSIYLN